MRTKDDGDEPQVKGIWMNPSDMAACFRQELVTLNIAFGQLAQVMLDERQRTGSWPYDEDLCDHLMSIAQVTGTAIIGSEQEGASFDEVQAIERRMREWRDVQDQAELDKLISSTLKAGR